MSNPLLGEVPLRLPDGREYTLVFDFGMRCEVEDLCNKPFTEVAREAGQGFHRAIRAFLWGALRRHHPDVKMAEVENLIEEHSEAVGEALGAAGEAAAQRTGDRQPENPPTKRRGRPPGKRSGGNGARRG